MSQKDFLFLQKRAQDTEFLLNFNYLLFLAIALSLGLKAKLLFPCESTAPKEVSE